MKSLPVDFIHQAVSLLGKTSDENWAAAKAIK